MLGRLFSSASSTAATSPSGTRPSTSHALESDELHTRNLLYPDTSSSVASSFHSAYSLAQSQSSASSFGYGDNIELEASRDVRVIIAQDAIATEHKLVIYDSKPSAQASATSVDDIPTSPTLSGPYGRSRRRNPLPAHATGPDDELRVFTDCMFGVAPLSYKGPSTKVHILPNIEERRPSVTITNPPMSSRKDSLRDGPKPPPQPQPQPAKDNEKRKSVLITRLFSVAIPPCPTAAVVEGGRNIPQSGSGDAQASTPTSSVGSTSGFPFPRVGGGGGQTSTPSAAPKLPKPSKQSMYAIGLIIALPPSASPPGTSFPLRCCHHKPMLSYDSDFLHHHEYCCPTPPNYDVDDFPRQGFKTECGLDGLHAAAAASDGRMDLITNHWDVITRALSDLQRVTQARIMENLTTARLASPQPVLQNGMKYLTNKCELRKMALMRDDTVRAEVEHLRWRVVSGVKLPRVVVGQGRWDLWQVEAKWANHRFGGRDMNFFFLTLLTAFLGHHTEWLDVLGPDAYKRRHLQQLKERKNPEDSAILARTVLLSSDRIAARKLIYLLSAFLPAKSHQTLDALPSPSRASSVQYLSQSPPTYLTSSAPGSKFGSLRRKARKRPSKLNMAVSSETESDDVSDASAGWTIPTSAKEASTPASVLQLPLGPSTLRKSESGTLTTLPSPATCAANTSTDARGIVRPSSSGSAASVGLISTLKRTGTANTSMDSTTWGSFLSFWSNPKSRSSTATSEASLQPDDFTPQANRVTKSLDDEEPLDVNEMLYDDSSHLPPFSPFLCGGSLPPTEQISVDDVDGAINVPLDLSTLNLVSPISSPPTSSWAMPQIHSGLGLGRPLPPPPPAAINTDDDSGPNVAGWIDDERFHPDFVLQAVKPYADIESDVKRAMRNEPTPTYSASTPWSETGTGSSPSPSEDRWVTVSEVLIADTKCLQIKRLRLRRRPKKTTLAPLQGHFRSYLATAPTVAAADEEAGDEEVMEEEVMVDIDDTLASAVEQVIEKDDCGNSTCKSAIIGALEQVVGEVMGGGPLRQRWGMNCLTEGVGRWIEEVA